jgi:hypothetical protein
MIMSERRPTFFISRSNGIFTPLIPADELPPDMVVVGVPKVMSFAQTTGMTSVGEVTPSGLHYQVKIEKDVDQNSGVMHPFVSSPPYAPLPSRYAPDGVPIVFAVEDGVGICSTAQGPSATSALASSICAISNPPSSVIENLCQANPVTGRLDNQQPGRSTQRGTANGGNGSSTGGVGLDRDNLEPTSQVTDADTPGRQPPLGAQVRATSSP